MIENDNEFTDILDIYNSLDDEPLLKKWGDMLVVDGSDTSLHPYIAELLMGMLNGDRYKNVVELSAHHGVLTKVLAHNYKDIQFTAISEHEIINSNVVGIPNVSIAVDASEVTKADFVIIDYSMTYPKQQDIDNVVNILYNNAGYSRMVILGYDGMIKDLIDDWVRDNKRIKKVYSKMHCIIFDIIK